MGGVSSTNNKVLNTTKQTSEVRQNSINDFYQETRSECLAFISQTIQDVTVYIGPGASLAGDITFTQKAEQEASCMLNTQLESLTTTQLDSIQAQFSTQEAENQTDPDIPTSVFGFAFGYTPGIHRTRNHTENLTEQVALTEQTMKNNITQMISTSCGATTEQMQQNIVVYLAEDAEVGGSVTFAQEAPQTLGCSILNASTVESSNTASAEQKQDSTQSAKQTSGMVDVIMIIAIALVAIAAIGVAFKYLTNKNAEDDAGTGEEFDSGEYVGEYGVRHNARGFPIADRV